jgi:hypothetical protein
MTKKSNEFSPKLKYYHIILIAMIISPFLVLNSNSINAKKEQRKIFKQNEIFMRKLYGRNLSFEEDTNEICKKGTEELQQYYEKGDPKIIKLDESEIKKENEGEYITALINLISGDGDSTENIKNYIMHLIPVLIFVVITILFLPGWLVCCICSCANCCCCCCCKKPKCKIPFYIVTCVIYALGIAISIYGLSQSDSVFVGLADTECSILKFVGEVLEGETKEELPKWGGISNIKNIFLETKGKINALSGDTTTKLTTNKQSAENAKTNFENNLDKYSKLINNEDGITGEGIYKQDLTDLSANDKKGYYYLDIVKQFGQFDKGTKSATPDTLAKSWYEEYKAVAENSDNQMGTVNSNYDKLIAEKKTATDALESGISSIESIESSFDSIKDSISQAIIEYSDIIEDYGKLGFKVVFSVLMVIDAAIAAFITLRIFTQYLVCKNGCLKCFLKSLIHILWNILAFITFFTLLLGFIFTLLGTVGKDLISVFSFLVSKENLNKGNDALLLGEAATYLTTCIDGTGDLKTSLNLNIDSMNYIESLKNASDQLKILRDNTTELLNNKFAYNAYKTEFDKRINYQTDDFSLIGTKILVLKTYLDNLNVELSGQNERWKISCEANEYQCDFSSRPSTPHENICIKPSTCKTKKLTDWYGSTLDSDNKKIVDAFIKSIQLASKTTIDSSGNTRSITKVLQILDDKYSTFLNSQTGSIKVFIDTIDDLTGIFVKFAGDEGGIFAMLNCLFIGRNVKVILKYLKTSLGTNIYTVGVCLLTTGIAMCVSIAFTILLNIIINTADNTNVEGDGVPEIGNDGNDPNVNFNNSPQGNYETEKTPYGGNYNQNNYNNNENYTGGVRIINYNN